MRFRVITKYRSFLTKDQQEGVTSELISAMAGSKDMTSRPKLNFLKTRIFVTNVVHVTRLL